MDITQRAELNTALLAVVLVVLGGIGLLLKQWFVYMTAVLQLRIDAVQKQVEDNHAAIVHISNSGGDEKIDNRLRGLGVIPPLIQGIGRGRRITDIVPPPCVQPSTQNTTEGTGNNNATIDAGNGNSVGGSVGTP